MQAIWATEKTKPRNPENVFNKKQKKILQPKEGNAYKGTRSLKNAKQIGPERKIPLPHNT